MAPASVARSNGGWQFGRRRHWRNDQRAYGLAVRPSDRPLSLRFQWILPGIPTGDPAPTKVSGGS